MITQQDLNISNISYTDKDFQEIYPELLDMVRNLTNRWDPSTSNESDPGLILLKLIAFIADKNNYNIDKSVLECFMPSATQESSMYKLCDLIGYNMKWYISATTTISCMYTGEETSVNIELPKYTTQFQNEDGSIVYTLLEDITLTTRGIATTGKAIIEGTVQELTIGNSNIITLQNIDENNRVYFPQSNIAENGVFINNIDSNGNEITSDEWVRVNNLNTANPSSKPFKVAYDSIRQLPYVEFSDNISDIIDSGIIIRYTVSSGERGNVNANILTAIVEGSVADIDTTSIVVQNASAAINGADPETIDEAYSSAKRIVGTFNTLVTPRDYANAIYNMIDEVTNNYFVSNCQVTDRRTDINYNTPIRTYGAYGPMTVNNIATTGSGNPEITAYELCLYPLRPLSVPSIDGYNNSFNYLSDSLNLITNTLEDTNGAYASYAHDYKELQAGDVILIKPKYPLSVKITTTSKVDSLEAAEVISNINRALVNAFNPRQLEYGYEIPYDSIYNVIQKADSRIKNVSLESLTPSITAIELDSNGSSNEVDFFNVEEGTTSPYIRMLAKNVLAGRTNLFDRNKEFKYLYGQTNGTSYRNITSLSTNANITFSNANNFKYTVRANEAIELITPNYSTTITYPYGVYYKTTNIDTTINANTVYKLTGNQTLEVKYTNSNDQEVTQTYTGGTVFQPNFNLNFNTASKVDGYAYLGTNEEIAIKEKVESVITSPNLKCFWVRGSTGDVLFTPEDQLGKVSAEGVYTYQIILQQSDYFYYTNNAMTELVILGSGTRLTYTTTTALTTSSTLWRNDRINELTLEDINTNGLAAFNLNIWYTRNFSNNNLTITNMVIYNFNEGYSVTLTGTTNSLSLTNKLQPLDSNIKVTYVEPSSTTSSPLPAVADGYQIRSRLNLNLQNQAEQALLSNQSISLNYKGSGQDMGTPAEIKGNDDTPIYIQSNIGITLLGEDNIAIGEIYPTLSLLSYEKPGVTAGVEGGTNPVENINVEDYFRINLSDVGNGGKIKLPLIGITSPDYQLQLMMIYWEGTDNTTIRISATGGDITNYHNTGDIISELSPGMNIIAFKSTSSTASIELTIKNATTTPLGALSFSPIYNTAGINSTFDLTSTEEEALINEIKKLDSKDMFDYTLEAEDYHLIEVDNMKSVYALYDPNNVYNIMVLPQIDISNSNISVVRSSRTS